MADLDQKTRDRVRQIRWLFLTGLAVFTGLLVATICLMAMGPELK